MKEENNRPAKGKGEKVR